MFHKNEIMIERQEGGVEKNVLFSFFRIFNDNRSNQLILFSYFTWIDRAKWYEHFLYETQLLKMNSKSARGFPSSLQLKLLEWSELPQYILLEWSELHRKEKKKICFSLVGLIVMRILFQRLNESMRFFQVP